MNNSFYRAFEDRYRGMREDIKRRLMVYLPFIQALHASEPGGVSLDIGCGRGEWLELLRDHGLTGQGIDLDEQMLQACTALGLTVRLGEALETLRELPDASVICISAFHVVEHLPFEHLQQVLSEAKRVLKPGGILIMETPNPENITVATTHFYLDPTHLRPIPPALLSFVAEYHGFKRIQILRLQTPEHLRQKQATSLWDVLSGVSPDYAVVAQKDASSNLLSKMSPLFEEEHGVTLEALADRYDHSVAVGAKKADEIKHHLERILNSRSWRMTAPLRLLKRKLITLRAILMRYRVRVQKQLYRLKKKCHLLKKPTVHQHQQLLVDISVLIQQDFKTGIQRVVKHLLHQLLLEPPPGYVVEAVYARRSKPGYYYARQYVATEYSMQQECTEDSPIVVRCGDRFIGLDLAPAHMPEQAFTLYQFKQAGVKCCVVVYDLLPVLRPTSFYPQLTEYYLNWLQVITDLDGAICISESVANELNVWLATQNKPEFMVKHFHLGADFKVPDEPRQKTQATLSMRFLIESLKQQTTFLAVNTIEPRKGYIQLLDAFDCLWSQGENVTLIIVGKEGWLMDAFIVRLNGHHEMGKRLFWFSHLDDYFLSLFYQTASCLIATSEAEGFGLSLVEAAHYHLPIIARDLPVFREIAKTYAYYFNGLSPDVLVECIQSWLLLYKQGLHPLSHGMARLTWQESAKQLKEALLMM